MKGVIAASLSLGLTLTGCSDSGDPDAISPSEPTSVTVTVVLIDKLPVEVLQNSGGRECTSVNVLAEAFGGEPTPPVEVTLRDAEGSIVATETLPKDGGTFSRASGCEWELTFDVDSSDFYEASVSSQLGETKATGETLDGAATVSVVF